MAKLLSDNLRLKFEPGALSKQPRQEERISDPNLLWQPESIVLRRTCHLENPQAAIDPDLAEALLKDRKGEEISPTDGRAGSLITSNMSTPSSSFKLPEPITTAASLPTASAPMANVITVPKAADESSKPTLVTATSPKLHWNFHAKHPCREDSPTRIDLYAMILDEPGELLGSAWQGIHCSSISSNTWRKKTGKVRIANFFDALVLASDNYEPGERAEVKAQKFLRHEKARIALSRKIID
ncbi:hypothetical protein V866_002912 [Kwoniella sp. B9012]